ncbi:MAG: hypothetical protein IKS07_05080 [Lachnospiraceae bacterium]|nr:hypothetical protein [Lachnospiraceae bacterium]
MTDYTRKLESRIEEFADDAYSEEEILSYLTDASSFLDFGRSLRRFIRERMRPDDPRSERAYLEELAAAQQITFNRNTLRSWFEGTAPKRGDSDRERMFQICFALGCSEPETEHFFRKVYGDRPFNMRSCREFVYYCCLRNGWTYGEARDLLGQVSFPEEKTDLTVYTGVLQQEATDLRTKEAVLSYLAANGHNFDLRNRTAKETLKRLLEQVRGRKGEEKLLEEGRVDASCSIIARECAADPYLWESFKMASGEKKTKKSLYSVSTMVDLIYGIDVNRARQEERGGAFLKNANLPKQIRSRLPVVQSFTKADPTAEELRKMIILLYSYWFWFSKKQGGHHTDLENYRESLNDLLCEAYLQPLYAGNPFDWFFLYCETAEDSLDLFRDLISEGLLADERM